jgi:sortase A
LSLLRKLELSSWVVGIAALAVYFGTQYSNGQARERSIAAFEAARASTQNFSFTPVAQPSSISRSISHESIDTSLWSPQRRAAYAKHASAQDLPEAILRAPSIGLIVPVFEGTSEHNLSRGAARIEGTARFGESGNIGIAAHRDGFFRTLKDIEVGDTLVLDGLHARRVYQVTETRIVEPSDISVLKPTGSASITLVTCYPFYFVGPAPRRFIVRARATE